MTREEFDVLVGRVESGVGRRPRALRLRIALLVVVGYAGLLAWLALVSLLGAGFFVLMLFADLMGKILLGFIGMLILIGGSWAVLRVLLVRLPPPEGRAINGTEAPRLQALLDELRARLRSPPFHRMLVTPDCNAAVVQVPRLGVLGWSRNYLLLGLPLLEGLSPDEVRAVLAHEFGHLSREHGRFSHWIYRLRRSWEQIFAQLVQPRPRGEVSLRPLIAKYVDWLWPRFNAHAFVLSRTNEYEADAEAARLAGADNLASALFRLALFDRQLDERFWPDLWQLANREPAPPSGVFLRMRDLLRAGPSSADGAKWAEQAFQLTTTNADTHPCLTDRLRALRCLPESVVQQNFPPTLSAPRPSAAEALLGHALESIRADVEQLWRKNCEPHWRDRHAKAASLSHRLSTLDQAVPSSAADVDGLWDTASVLIDLHGDKAAETLLRQILDQQPAHVAANLHLGRLLLGTGHDEGEVHLERAMAAEEEVTPQACELLHAHYRRTGRIDRLRELNARLDRYEQAVAASFAERSTVQASDEFIPHGLNEVELGLLREVVAAEMDLSRAELARKHLRHFPKQKLFLLCVRCRPAWHRLPSRDLQQRLVQRLSQAVRLPGRVLVFAPSGSFRALARKLRNVPGAMVFER